VSLYVDTSALLKRYVSEDNTEIFNDYLAADTVWLTARLTSVETRRNLGRLLEGSDLMNAQSLFLADWEGINVIELDVVVCDLAGDIAEISGVRTLDALHLAAAQRVGGGNLPFLTADRRQAQAARDMGWIVLGV
jgi:predicted nucleic acid-binding protein